MKTNELPTETSTRWECNSSSPDRNPRAMKDLLSPKQVARAIGVSESSLKRWCDRGVIPMERTAGGHRRMRLDSVLAFIRAGKYELKDAEVLGLPATTGQTEWTVRRAREQLRESLVAGNEDVCRQIVLDMFLAEQAISHICDQVIAAAFHEIGDLWDCGNVQVYEERRACEICVRLIHELRRIVPQPPEDSPRAFGGTIDGDPYTLAVSMAELVLLDAGWKAASLGHMLPFETIRTAMTADRPKLVWISISSIRDEDRFVFEVNESFEVAESIGAALVLGGCALSEDLRRRIRYSTFCDNFQHLSDFSRIILQTARLESAGNEVSESSPEQI